MASANWTDVLNAEDVNHAWQTWKTRLLEIADRHIPKRLVPINSPRYRPWMNGRLKQAIREKHRLFRTYKQNPTPHGWNMFKQQRNKVTSMLRTAKSDFIFTLATDEHRNSETSHSARDGEPAAAGPQSHNLPRLHQFLRVFTKSKPSFTPPLLDDSGSLVEKDVDKAEILNAFFRQTGFPVDTRWRTSTNRCSAYCRGQPTTCVLHNLSLGCRACPTCAQARTPHRFDGSVEPPFVGQVEFFFLLSSPANALEYISSTRKQSM